VVSLITSIIGIATALTIVVLIRKDYLHVRYGLWWMAAAFVFATLGLFPRIVDYIAGHLGIGYPPVLAIILGFIAVVLKILLIDIERSRNAIKMQRMVQRIALLEAELRDSQASRRHEGSSPRPVQSGRTDSTDAA